ncbi:macrolide transporter subunit MacA [soil metagenome]
MKAKWGLALTVVAAVGLAGAWAAYAFTRPSATHAEPGVPVVLGDVTQEVVTLGAYQPTSVVEIGAQTSGQVAAVKVKIGDRVAAGQPLIQFDTTALEIKVREAKTIVQQNVAGMAQIQAQLEQDEADSQRQKALVEKGYTTQERFEQTEGQRRRNRAQMDRYRNQILNDGTSVEAAEINLARATVRAPMAGVVVEVLVKQGQQVNATDQTPILARIARLDEMVVHTPVPESDIMKVKIGQTVYFAPDNQPGKWSKGVVRSRSVLPTTQALDRDKKGLPRDGVYYDTTFSAANRDEVLLPAMTVNVRIVVAQAKGVPTMPTAALGARGPDGRFAVRVIGPDGGEIVRRVSVGARNPSTVQIKDGLKLGERVILYTEPAS